MNISSVVSSATSKATDWRVWLDGLIGATISMGAGSVSNILSRPDVFNFQNGFTDLWHTAAIQAGVGAFLYLRQKPTPTYKPDLP